MKMTFEFEVERMIPVEAGLRSANTRQVHARNSTGDSVVFSAYIPDAELQEWNRFSAAQELRRAQAALKAAEERAKGLGLEV